MVPGEADDRAKQMRVCGFEYLQVVPYVLNLMLLPRIPSLVSRNHILLVIGPQELGDGQRCRRDFHNGRWPSLHPELFHYLVAKVVDRLTAMRQLVGTGTGLRFDSSSSRLWRRIVIFVRLTGNGFYGLTIEYGF